MVNPLACNNGGMSNEEGIISGQPVLVPIDRAIQALETDEDERGLTRKVDRRRIMVAVGWSWYERYGYSSGKVGLSILLSYCGA